MYPLNDSYRKTLIENKLEVTSKRVAGYFDLILKNDDQGEKNIKHIFTVENEELLFYKIPEDELKKFWETVEKKAYSSKQYTKAEEWELHDFFWETYIAN